MSGIINFLNTPQGGGSGLLLDLYPNATRGYSLEYINSNFIGNPVIRVMRDSDNNEQDFTPNEITNGDLETFVGVGNNGFVVTIYNQSGITDIDLFQTTKLNAGRIVLNGSLLLKNGKPYIDIWSRSYTRSLTLKKDEDRIFHEEDTLSYIVYEPYATGFSNIGAFMDTAGGDFVGRTGITWQNRFIIIKSNTTNIARIDLDTSLFNGIYQPLILDSKITDPTPSNRLELYNQNGKMNTVDNTQSGGITIGENTFRTFSLGGGEGTGYLINKGVFQEYVVWNQANKPNRTDVLNNILNRYTF